MNFFKILCIVTAALFVYLFLTLLLNSYTFIKDIGLEPCESAIVLAPRTAIFMLGIAVLMIGSINLPPSKARQSICLSVAITMFGLATMGTYEFFRDTVNSSIIQAIVIESVLGTCFSIVYIKNWKKI